MQIDQYRLDAHTHKHTRELSSSIFPPLCAYVYMHCVCVVAFAKLIEMCDSNAKDKCFMMINYANCTYIIS